MNNGTLNYGQLYDKLRALGFQQQPVEIDGKRGQVFLHPTLAQALIVLPERDRSATVEPFYLSSVLATLRTHHLLAENNPLLA
jgi:hypothetical protein